MNKITDWAKGHKTLAVLVLALMAAAAAAAAMGARRQAAAGRNETEEETAFVERRSIERSVSAAGRIISDNTRSLTAPLAGFRILSVEAEVGDSVRKGDVICTFDTEGLERELRNAEKTLSAAQKQGRLSVEGAKRALRQAGETRDYQIEAAARSVVSACDSYSAARDAYEEGKERLIGAGNELDSAEAALDALSGRAEELNRAVAEAEARKAAAKTPADLEEADAALKNAREALAAFDAQAGAAGERYSAALAAYDALKSSLPQLESAVSSAGSACEGARAAYDYTVATQNNQYEGSRDALSGAKSSAGAAAVPQEGAVDAYREKLEEGSLRAGIDGVVTMVNVKPGDIYAGGVVAAIQDCGALVVSAEIDEYDISDIELGMRAVFRTDATRDERLEGRVIFISPTPTAGSDVTYQVKVSIDVPAGRLRIGMNARLSIILARTGSVLAVPYDAVSRDEKGRDIVYTVRRDADGTVTKTAVPVTVGVEGDYYVEVSGGIREGDEICLPKDDIIDFADMVNARMGSVGRDGAK